MFQPESEEVYGCVQTDEHIIHSQVKVLRHASCAVLIMVIHSVRHQCKKYENISRFSFLIQIMEATSHILQSCLHTNDLKIWLIIS